MALCNTELRGEKDKEATRQKVRRQGGCSVLCLGFLLILGSSWRSAHTCKIPLLCLGVKAELKMLKKEFPLALRGTQQRRTRAGKKKKGRVESPGLTQPRVRAGCTEPKVCRRISVSLSWLQAQVKKPIIWEWWKAFLIGMKHEEICQMLKWAKPELCLSHHLSRTPGKLR